MLPTTLRLLFVGEYSFRNQKFVNRLVSNHPLKLVSWITDGAEAINDYRNCSPQLVIIDPTTRQLSGGEVARWIGEQSPALKIFIRREIRPGVKVCESTSI